MAQIEFKGTGTVVIVDDETKTITIDRDGTYEALPKQTVIPFDQITGMKYEPGTAAIGRGTSTLVFLYPGAPEVKSMVTDIATHENLVQFKARKGTAIEDLKAMLRPYVVENRKRLEG